MQNGTDEGRIVSETERDPGDKEAEAHSKFLSRRDRALAILYYR